MSGLLTMGGVVLAVLNSLVLVGLGIVWLRNYRLFRSPLVLALLGASLILLVENLVAVYLFLTGMSAVYAADPLVGQVIVGMRLLESVAIAFLAYATVQ
jgi:hypothetical protein